MATHQTQKDITPIRVIRSSARFFASAWLLLQLIVSGIYFFTLTQSDKLDISTVFMLGIIIGILRITATMCFCITLIIINRLLAHPLRFALGIILMIISYAINDVAHFYVIRSPLEEIFRGIAGGIYLDFMFGGIGIWATAFAARYRAAWVMLGFALTLLQLLPFVLLLWANPNNVIEVLVYNDPFYSIFQSVLCIVIWLFVAGVIVATSELALALYRELFTD